MSGGRFFTTFGCAAALVLGGCGNLQPPAPGAAQRQGASPMKAGLSKQDLIYVTNRDSEVTVYNLATQAIVGVLTHFTSPMGECVDTSGNVYITDSSADEVFEYAHGGSKPIKTLNDSPDTPRTCAVDPTTGNLAVANDDGSSHEGNIAIWPEGSGQPTRYTNSTLYNFVGCAYDANGNLLTTNESAFAWLPHGGSTLVNVAIPPPKSGEKWGGIEGIQWDGHLFVLDGGQYVYRVSVLHGLGYYIGYITLNNEGETGPYWIFIPKLKSQSAQILGGTYEGNNQYDVESFDYPGGGDPLFEITHGIDVPIGVVVSPKTQ
ncbi:MAG: hypothetical protein ABSD52_06535 [Candidatus Cybelea sp.]|jgi:hypothetical protein